MTGDPKARDMLKKGAAVDSEPRGYGFERGENRLHQHSRKKSSEARASGKKSGAVAKALDFARGFALNDDFKLLVKGITAVAALLSLLLLYIAGADFRPSALVQGFRDKSVFIHASGDGFPVSITGGRIIAASGINNGTAVLTDTKCLVFDGKGRKVSAENHLLASPAMESKGNYMLLYDRLGLDFSVRTPSGEICSGDTPHPIICADMSRSGRFALITNSDTNNARLFVYASDGTVLHRWKSVNYKISDVALSPSGKYVAICGLSVGDGELVSTVILQQVGAKKNLKEYKFDNSLIVDIAFDGNSRIVAVGESFATYLSLGNGKNTIYDYENRTLHSYDFSDNGDLALVFSEHSDGRNSSVVVIDSDCSEKAHINTDLTAPYVDLENGLISLLNNSVVTSYSYRGKLLQSSEVEADCQSIFTSGGRLLTRGVVYLSEVE